MRTINIMALILLLGMASASNPLEQQMEIGFDSAIGNPIIFGFMVFIFIVAFSFMQRLDVTGKTIAIIGGGLLVIKFIPFLNLFLMLFVSILVYLALSKLFSRG
jgi:CBS domain containing-hemolysin-like protein